MQPATRLRDLGRSARRAAVGSLAALTLLVTLVASPVLAQEAARSIRIGIVLPSAPEGEEGALMAAFIDGAEKGAVMAMEEFAFNASLFGIDFTVTVEHAADNDMAAAAERLRAQDVDAMAGGVGHEDAAALSRWAAEAGLPFINLAAPSDALRHAECSATTFHIAPSAAMYLDAIAGWYVRSGFRRWFFVRADTDEAKAQYDRLTWGLRERHFGAGEVGNAVVASGAETAGIAGEILASGADVVVLLLDAGDQLAALTALEAGGVQATVTGFPYPETQTRTFFEASRAAAPTLGAGFRATAWEATLDAYGARELNARYLLRWDAPMEFGGWASYQAIKTFYEAMTLGAASSTEEILAYLTAETSVFDVWKGIGTTFRPWDHQMRQSLYLVQIASEDVTGLHAALLVGELPAIYMPGTEPVERLDQLGDLAARSACRM